MDKIASFTVDHLKLKAGLYLSRSDKKGDVNVTTFDLRFTAPNREPVMDMSAVHTNGYRFCKTILKQTRRKCKG